MESGTLVEMPEKSVPFTIRVLPDEKAEWERVSKEEHYSSVSEWARRILRLAAAGELVERRKDDDQQE